LSAALVLTLALAAAPGAERELCLVCHGEEARALEQGVHAHAGLTCVVCHGGDPTATEVEEAHSGEFLPLVAAEAAVQTCAGCHSDVERMRPYGLRTDQYNLYLTSQHGKAFAQGDENVATCVDCHGGHEIRRASDPLSSVHKSRQPETCGRCHSDSALMGRYGLPSNQPELFQASVHGRALLSQGHASSPACTDCHGRHGALPPRVDEVELVCGHCHVVVQAHFEASPHFGVRAGEETVHCVSCHGSHSVQEPGTEMFVGAEKGHCGSCHTEPGDPALEVAGLLRGGIETLASSITSTEQDLAGAGRRGIYIDAEHGYVDEARGLLVRARTLTHEVSAEALVEFAARGDAMIQQTRESLGIKQRGLRDRMIFTGIFFVLTILLSLVLLMYAREIRGPWGARRSSAGGPSQGGGHDA
jgi:hypothetical protein